MNNEFKGFDKVFSFTFGQHVKSPGYKRATIIIALLCFLLPLIIMSAVEYFGGSAEADTAVLACRADTVFVSDSTSPAADLSVLNGMEDGFSSIKYVVCSSVDEAFSLAEKSPLSLVLAVDEGESGFDLSVMLPANSELSSDDANGYSDFLDRNFGYVLLQKSGLDESQLFALYSPVQTEVTVPAAEGDEAVDAPAEDSAMKEVLTSVLPYVNVMVLYFMILIYGQGVANSVIMEKTSKLMDFFLVTVKPAAMVMGKVLAIVAAAIMQVAIWALSLVFGFAVGDFAVKLLNPETEMGLVKAIDSLDFLSGMFSIPAIIVSLLIVLAGFLLYCSVAAIGGSMASKPEDLSSTNILFSLVLVASFFCVLFSGTGDGMVSSSEWLNWFPFASVLITPGRVLAGTASVWTGLGSLALCVLCSVVMIFISGKIYKMMSLYKGDPPSVAKVFSMLKSSAK